MALEFERRKPDPQESARRVHEPSRANAGPLLAALAASVPVHSRALPPRPFPGGRGRRGRDLVEIPVREWSERLALRTPTTVEDLIRDRRQTDLRSDWRLMRRKKQPARCSLPAAELPPRPPLPLRQVRRCRPRGDWEPAPRPFRCRPDSGPFCLPDGSVPKADVPGGKRSESS